MIPVELLNQIIKYLDHESIPNLIASFEGSEVFEALDSEKNWQCLFADSVPIGFKSIKHLISIDHTLRTHRYQRIWRTWYLDFKYYRERFEYNQLLLETISYDYDASDILLDLSIETANIFFALKLYEKFPLFYNKIIKYLPDTPYTKNMIWNSISRSSDYNKDIKLIKYLTSEIPDSDTETIDYMLSLDISIAFIYSEEICSLYTEKFYNASMAKSMKKMIMSSLNKYTNSRTNNSYVLSYLHAIYKKIFKKMDDTTLVELCSVNNIYSWVNDMLKSMIFGFKPDIKDLIVSK